LQLYSQGTPNGVKVTILLEELLATGHAGAEYDAWLIQIGKGDQFGSGFVGINPNSKIPAMVDHSVTPALRLFESGSMMLYLAEKFGAFLPKDIHGRAECLNWLFWQMGSAPYLGGGFGHRPLCHGSQAATGRAGPQPRRQALHDRRRLHDRRHRDLGVVWATGAGPPIQCGRIP
jgi:glutathione S-transferase